VIPSMKSFQTFGFRKFAFKRLGVKLGGLIDACHAQELLSL
jgi:hypothetical protein